MTQARPQDRQPLVDSRALDRRRARARPDEARFLHDAACDEIKERLIDVNRSFTSPALITAFPELWAEAIPGTKAVAPADILDLAPGAHDLVIHAMALHWAEDPVGQIVQCRRALAPDGLFLCACLGGESLQELRASLGQAEIEVSGGLSPRVAPMAELRDLGGLVQRAGLALPVADSQRLTATYPDLFALMSDLRAMGETNALAARLRHPTRRAVFDRAAALYAEAYPAAGGRIRATFELMFLTGWAPHDSQQAPLRPGSARTRLADALDTTEFDETGVPALGRRD